VVYSSSDLRLLQSLLDDILCSLARESRFVDTDHVALKVKLATALFAASADGERNYSRLRQQALATISAFELLGS